MEEEVVAASEALEEVVLEEGELVAAGKGHRAQGTGHRAQGHRAQGTEHRAQSTEHRAQSTGYGAQLMIQAL